MLSLSCPFPQPFSARVTSCYDALNTMLMASGQRQSARGLLAAIMASGLPWIKCLGVIDVESTGCGLIDALAVLDGNPPANLRREIAEALAEQQQAFCLPTAILAFSFLRQVRVLVHVQGEAALMPRVVEMTHASVHPDACELHLLCRNHTSYSPLVEVTWHEAFCMPQSWLQPLPGVGLSHEIPFPDPETTAIMLNDDGEVDQKLSPCLRAEVDSFAQDLLACNMHSYYVDRVLLISRQAWLRRMCERWPFPCRMWARLVYHTKLDQELEVAAFVYTLLGGGYLPWTRVELAAWQRRLRKRCAGQAFPCQLWCDLVYRVSLRAGQDSFRMPLRLCEALQTDEAERSPSERSI